MENQHRKISGYRELGQWEIDLMNRIKEHEAEAARIYHELADYAECGQEPVDMRALNLGRTDMQTGYMWLIRSIARPQSGW